MCDHCIINTGDSLSYHNNQQFSTKDHDNNAASQENCANKHRGGWWYRSCYKSNLNGNYYKNRKIELKGVVWYYWKHNHESLKEVTMKIRPNVIN